MGQNNRARRAAKQRKRQRAGQGGTSGGWSPLPPPDAIDLAVYAIRHAEHQRDRGVPMADCVRPLLAAPEATIDKAVELIVADAVRAVFSGGWTPVDLVELGRRRTDAAGGSYLLDAVASVTAQYPDRLVDPHWRAQLDRFDAQLWWDRRRPHLSQWASRRCRARHEALTVVLDVLGMFDRLPMLDPVLPPPGTPISPGRAHEVDPAQEKALAKIRALLAKAESTDFDDEAEALSAKAQELMSRYALDRALIDHQHGVRQQATLRRIWLDNPYVTAKAMLVDAVANANRCRTVLAGEWGYATVVGDQVDLQLVELLATSLLLQASRAMLSTGSQLSRSGVSRTRSYRQSFLVAYADRIGERLRSTNEASQSASDAGKLLPVLSARSRVVDDLLEQRFPNLVSKQVSVSNSAGWGAGRAAADLALFDVHEALNDDCGEGGRRAG
jgi:hypothetical protein